MYMKIAPRKEEGSSCTYIYLYIEVEGTLHLFVGKHKVPLNPNCRHNIFPSPL
jgi:hypothetical protein